MSKQIVSLLKHHFSHYSQGPQTTTRACRFEGGETPLRAEREDRSPADAERLPGHVPWWDELLPIRIIGNHVMMKPPWRR